MGRLARHLFTLCSAVSLLLCVAILLLRLALAGMREVHFVWEGALFHIGHRELIVLWTPVDYWFLAAIAAVLPAWWAVSRWPRLRTVDGRGRVRHQFRRAFTICSAVSLAMWLAVVALWVRSHSIAEQASFYGDSKWLGVTSARGSVVIGYISTAVVAPDADLFLWNRWNASHVRSFVPRLHLLAPARYTPAKSPGEATTFAASYGLISLILLAAPAVKVVPVVRRTLGRFQRWHLPAPGLCPACGYDLRASPGRCPECGAAKAG